jgi:hypothetical protein
MPTSAVTATDVNVVVQDQPSIWQWLGPVLLFAGSIITLVFTLTSANKREWMKWRRDTLIKLCSDAVTEARDVMSLCESALTQTRHAFAQANLAAAAKSGSRIGTISEQLYLINANFLADTCASMRDAANALNAPTTHLRTGQMNAGSQRERDVKQLNAEGPGWFAGTPGAPLEESNPAYREYLAKCTEINERIHRHFLAEPESRYNEARDALEDIRARFLERRRIELK